MKTMRKRATIKRYLVEVTVNAPDEPNEMPALTLQMAATSAMQARSEARKVADEKLSARAKRLGYSIVVVGRLEA